MTFSELPPHLAAMSPIEAAFKSLLGSEAGDALRIPNTPEHFMHWLRSRPGVPEEVIGFIRAQEIGDGNIPEERFLPPDADMTVMKHMRYLPALLHMHEFIKFVCVFSGTASLYCNDTAHPLVAGDICLVPPGMNHCLLCYGDEDVVLNVVIRRSTFDTAFFSLLSEKDPIALFFTRILYSAEKRSPIVRFRTGDDRSLTECLIRMFETSSGTQRYRKRLANLWLMMFCTLLLENHEEDVSVFSPDESSPDDQIVSALRHIQRHYSTATLAGVAGHFNYSEAHFSRMIREYTGKTFRDIVREIKVHKAAELLQNPDIPVDEIVRQVGYTDSSHFYRNFKQFYGMTPISYREQQREQRPVP